MSTDCASSSSRCASCESCRSHTNEGTSRYNKDITQWEFIAGQQNTEVVDRFVRKLHLTQQDAEELFMDVKRFLWMHALSDSPISPPAKVDDGWHEFILFTEDYADFCKNFLGGFIHHRPNRKSDPPNNGQSTQRTKEMLLKYFPDRVPTKNWAYHNPQCSTDCKSGPGCT